MSWFRRAGFSAVLPFLAATPALLAGDPPSAASRSSDDDRISVREDFEAGAERWEPTDAEAWRVQATDGGSIYVQHKKRSDYEPPHRSPFNISLLKDVVVGDFELNVRVRSTHPDYGHRDVCLFFGYQDPANFYYVHLGKQTDDHANQIFIVNDAPRTKISERTTEGTDWDDEWHHVRIVRRVNDGLIEIYFDDMNEPVMVAHNTEFTWGRVGLGSFDDTSAWDDFQLEGERVAETSERE